MNFLAPWFLAAAALVAGPIIAHLIRRVTRERVAFSATRFLLTSPPQLQSRKRLQHPWLLLLRCLIVALLASAFARPFFRDHATVPPPLTASQDVVMLLDESASMQRAGVWKEARDRVVRAAEALGPSDRCAVLLASAGVTPLLSFEQWTELPPSDRAPRLRALLAEHEPGWGPFFLDTAMDPALELLTDKAQAPRTRVIVVSDFASGTRVSELAGRDWPPGCEVVLEQTFPPITNNAGVQFLGWSETPGSPAQARVRVTRDQGAPPLQLSLQLRDGLTGQERGAPQTLELGAGETRLVPVPLPQNVSGPMEVSLSGDSEPFDNHVWFVPPQRRTALVVYLGRHEANDPQHAHFYVSRALGSAPDLKISTEVLDPQGPIERLAAASLVIVAERPSAAALGALRARVEAGAFAVITVSDPGMIEAAASLAGETGWAAAKMEKGAALLGQIDFAHPLFSLFADPRFSDFSHLRFWHPLAVELPAASTATVVARFDDGSPAVLESTVGRGRVITWGGDWSPSASQWVLSTKFVPWLQSLLERAAGGPARPTYAEITDATRLTHDPAARWRSARDAAEAFLPATPSRPGLYQIKDYEGTHWVALELPAEESRTDPLPLDTFEQLGVPTKPPKPTSILGVNDPGYKVLDAAALEIESRQKIWRWLLIGAAVLLAVESIAARLLAHRENAEESVPAGS